MHDNSKYIYLYLLLIQNGLFRRNLQILFVSICYSLNESTHSQPYRRASEKECSITPRKFNQIQNTHIDADRKKVNIIANRIMHSCANVYCNLCPISKGHAKQPNEDVSCLIFSKKKRKRRAHKQIYKIGRPLLFACVPRIKRQKVDNYSRRNTAKFVMQMPINMQ